MKFDHITYAEGTGKYSKQIETYNFHKAASVLAEYGFDCIRISDDWAGADFLAHHKETGVTLQVQQKSALVMDERLEEHLDLYICFPLDRMDSKWYLLPYSQLMAIALDHAPQWFETNGWKHERPEGRRHYWTRRATPEVRCALEPFAYRALHGEKGYGETRKEVLELKKKAAKP